MTKKSAFTSLLFLTVVALGASGCGKSLPKLTADQKAALGSTLQSAAQPPQAAQNLGQEYARGGMRLSSPFAAFVGLARTGSTPSNDTESQFETKLRHAHEAKTCDVVASVPSSSQDFTSASVGISNMSMKVSGSNCPLALDMAISVQGSQNSAEAKISGQFTVTDADLAKINDVNQMSFDGSLKANGNSSSADISADVKGTLTSQKYGKVTFEVTADGTASRNSADMDVIADFVFPDFEAKLEMKTDGKTNTYKLNGEDVTEQELKSYLSKAGMAGPNAAGNANPALPGPVGL